MKIFLKAVAATAVATMVPLSPAIAQQATAAAPGMEVVDTNGQTVGTVIQVSDGVYVVKTDRHEAALPADSFTAHEGKLLFGMSRADLNASVDEAEAAAAASVAVGKPVKSVNGVSAGTIDEIGANYIQLELPSGNMVRIPKDAIRGEADAAMVFFELAALEADSVPASEVATEEVTTEEVAEQAAEAAEEAEEAAEAAEELADEAQASDGHEGHGAQ